jgi:predicted Fe-Mo cluster-binding NifX family protein
VFDAAHRLMLIDIDAGEPTNRREVVIEETGLTQRAAHFVRLSADVLICSAISRPLEAMLVVAGVEVIPRTCGDVEDVLSAFVAGKLTERAFLMPGCCNRGRRGRRRGARRGGRGRADYTRARRQSMKVAVTSQGEDMSSEVDPRFGRAAYFIVIDTETGAATAHENSQNLNAAQGAGIQAARNVIELGVEAVVTGNVGPKAFSVLKSGDVEVHIGAEGTVADAIEKMKAGQLECTNAANVEGHWV